MQELQYLGPVKLVEAAMSSVHGTALFPDAEAGRECFGLDFNPENNPYGTVEVEVKTLDSLMRSESIETIDFLSIDAEGHDVRVLLGALHTLAAHKIRYFEFEYSEHGKWATSDLEDVIDMLDHFGYDEPITYFAKQIKYAELRASDKFAKGKRGSFLKLGLVGPYTFFKTFVLGRLFLSGRAGLVVATAEAVYAFCKEAHLLKLGQS